MSAPLKILYQDEWLVAVDKPPGQLIHPADVPQEGDEVTMKILRDQLGQLVYTVHRLDRPTTGVLLFALNKGVARAMNRAFERHQVQKTYWAVVQGDPPADHWENLSSLQKNEEDPPRDAHTSFQILKKHPLGEFHLLEARPHSGRYHQIRRHLTIDDMPIVGDFRYGGIERGIALGKRLGIASRMLLQAKKLEFTHPKTATQVSIVAETAPEIAKVMVIDTHHIHTL